MTFSGFTYAASVRPFIKVDNKDVFSLPFNLLDMIFILTAFLFSIGWIYKKQVEREIKNKLDNEGIKEFVKVHIVHENGLYVEPSEFNKIARKDLGKNILEAILATGFVYFLLLGLYKYLS